MAKSNQQAMVKLQCPPATRPRRPRWAGARPARRQHHGVLQAVQRAHAGPGRAHHPGRDHDLHRPLVHLHHQDAAGAGAAQARGGARQGSGVPNRNKVGKVTAAQVREIAELKMPDLNAAIVEAPRAWCAARPAAWASTSRAEPDRRHCGVPGSVATPRGSACARSNQRGS